MVDQRMQGPFFGSIVEELSKLARRKVERIAFIWGCVVLGVIAVLAALHGFSAVKRVIGNDVRLAECKYAVHHVEIPSTEKPDMNAAAQLCATAFIRHESCAKARTQPPASTMRVNDDTVRLCERAQGKVRSYYHH